MAVVTGRPRIGHRWEYVLSATDDSLPYPVTAQSIYIMTGTTAGAAEVKVESLGVVEVIYSGTPATSTITPVMAMRGWGLRIDNAVVSVPANAYVVFNTIGHTVEPPI